MPEAHAVAAELSYQLSGLVARDEYFVALGELLDHIIPGDLLYWGGLHPPETCFEIHEVHGRTPPVVVDAHAAVVAKHPIIRALRASPTLAAVRITDVISDDEWHSHEVRRALQELLGVTFQMCVLSEPMIQGVPVWSGWAFNRSDRDFADAEAATLSALQPSIAVLNRVNFLNGITSPTRSARDDLGLTARESDILAQLALGLSAAQIALVCRINVGTVRKHLEHVYAKLGCGDRLTAVMRARALGILDSLAPVPATMAEMASAG